jgi:2-methylisocitrate lyase-like PEP mutase family enzyme
MRTQAEKTAAFRALHARPGVFIIPNPWDAGTARILAALGFEALATTSLGLANSLGRPDGANAVSRREVLDNCRAIAAATDLPVNADLENGYAHEPRAAAEMIRLLPRPASLVAPSRMLPASPTGRSTTSTSRWSACRRPWRPRARCPPVSC